MLQPPTPPYEAASYVGAHYFSTCAVCAEAAAGGWAGRGCRRPHKVFTDAEMTVEHGCACGRQENMVTLRCCVWVLVETLGLCLLIVVITCLYAGKVPGKGEDGERDA